MVCVKKNAPECYLIQFSTTVKFNSSSNKHVIVEIDFKVQVEEEEEEEALNFAVVEL